MMARTKKYNSNIHRELRAEAFGAALAASAGNNGILLAEYAGSFRRSYRNDIEQVNSSADEDAPQSETTLVINRDGLYDRLPEGLFHQSRGSSRNSSVGDMTAEHRRFKEEEKSARLFFRPLEQAFFDHAVLTELEEQNLSLAMLGGGMKNELREFWGLDKGLAPEHADALSALLPWTCHIKGSLRLTARALSLLVGKPIQANESVQYSQHALAPGFRLGGCGLGTHTVAGSGYNEGSVQWTFSIAEVGPGEMSQFTPEGRFGRLLQQFEEIFVPLTVDASFVPEQGCKADDTGPMILGYGMRL